MAHVSVCFRRQKTAEKAGSVEEDVDELSLIDHKEIMSRITLKQEVSRLLVVCDVFSRSSPINWPQFP